MKFLTHQNINIWAALAREAVMQLSDAPGKVAVAKEKVGGLDVTVTARETIVGGPPIVHVMVGDDLFRRQDFDHNGIHYRVDF